MAALSVDFSQLIFISSRRLSLWDIFSSLHRTAFISLFLARTRPHLLWCSYPQLLGLSQGVLHLTPWRSAAHLPATALPWCAPAPCPMRVPSPARHGHHALPDSARRISHAHAHLLGRRPHPVIFFPAMVDVGPYPSSSCVSVMLWSLISLLADAGSHPHHPLLSPSSVYSPCPIPAPWCFPARCPPALSNPGERPAGSLFPCYRRGALRWDPSVVPLALALVLALGSRWRSCACSSSPRCARYSFNGLRCTRVCR